MNRIIVLLLGLTTLMFVGLKLAKVIVWSWFLVFSPVLLPIIFWICLVVIARCYLIYQYKHDEEFHRAIDACRELKKRGEMTLADRLKEMKEEQHKLLKGEK